MSIPRHLVKATTQPGLFIMKGKLTEPRVITDYRGEPVCILPIGFYFTDERWQAIWQRFEEKDEALSHEDLRILFPDEPALVPRIRD
jgi:hypothetical protein